MLNYTPSSDHLATDSRDKAPACYTGHCRAGDHLSRSPHQGTSLAKVASLCHQ